MTNMFNNGITECNFPDLLKLTGIIPAFRKEMLQTRVITGRSAYYHVYQNFFKNYTLYKLACI